MRRTLPELNNDTISASPISRISAASTHLKSRCSIRLGQSLLGQYRRVSSSTKGEPQVSHSEGNAISRSAAPSSWKALSIFGMISPRLTTIILQPIFTPSFLITEGLEKLARFTIVPFKGTSSKSPTGVYVAPFLLHSTARRTDTASSRLNLNAICRSGRALCKSSRWISFSLTTSPSIS